jgi:hypothetical protein
VRYSSSDGLTVAHADEAGRDRRRPRRADLVLAFVAASRLGTVRFAPLPVRLWPGKFREPDIVFVRAEHEDRITDAYSLHVLAGSVYEQRLVGGRGDSVRSETLPGFEVQVAEALSAR